MGDRRGAYKVLVGRPEGWNHFEDLGVDGRIILKCTFKKGDEGMEWIDLAQDRDTWRAAVCAITNLLP
jgi:hypothetical protein